MSRNYYYTVPLIYASSRKYPKKEIVMYLLEETYKYYSKNDLTEELEIIIYSVFIDCLENSWYLNPFNFKDKPDFDIPDRILELGFGLNYKIGEKYYNVLEIIDTAYLSKFQNDTIKNYFKAKGFIE